MKKIKNFSLHTIRFLRQRWGIIAKAKLSKKNLVARYILNIIEAPRLSLQGQSMFAKRLAILSKSGLPILDSLNLLLEQSRGRERKMFETVVLDVSEGKSLFMSLSKYHKVFGDFALNMIRVGETAGMFSDNLHYLSQEIDKKRELRGKVLGALMYPFLIMIAVVFMGGFLTFYLFPKLIPVFKSLNVELPLATRILIWVSQFLTNHGVIVIGFIFLLMMLFFFFIKKDYGRLLFDDFLLKVFLVGDFIRCYQLAVFCRTFGLLLKGQLNILEAINIVLETTANSSYKKEIQHLFHAVSRGSEISRQLALNHRLFPTMFTGMLAIGERTGSLPTTLMNLSDIYEQELDEKTKQFSSVIEPIMMLLMGIFVGFLAISIITPIYAVTQNIR